MANEELALLINLVISLWSGEKQTRSAVEGCDCAMLCGRSWLARQDQFQYYNERIERDRSLSSWIRQRDNQAVGCRPLFGHRPLA